MGDIKLTQMSEINFKEKKVCIVKFGPPSASSGMRPAEYYQVTIDPAYVSNSGEFIKFGVHSGDEIQGWQRIEALTVVEVLDAEWDEDGNAKITVGHDSVQFQAVDRVDNGRQGD